MRKFLPGLAAAILVLAVTACGSPEGTGVRANMGVTVGIALPNRTSSRWIADGNNLVQQFKAMGYKVDLQYADDLYEKQMAQVQTMVDRNEKLLVIAAVDGATLKGALASAAKARIPVIAYDRLILESPDVSYYASFDNFQVGVLQGQLLVDHLGLSKRRNGPFTIELFAGSPDDNNAKYYYNGAMKVLEPYLKSGRLVVKSGQTAFEDVTTLRADGTYAQQRMNIIMGRFYRREKLDAVLSPYDGISIGVIKALRLHGYTGSRLPAISGQDAEISSVKAIIAGEQTATIYKDTRELAKVTVQMSNALLTGAKPIINDTTTYNNGVKTVSTYLLPPVSVDLTNYRTILVDGGYYTPAELD